MRNGEKQRVLSKLVANYCD